ncbi:hypothetical protein [Amycolatopsis solani]|uniref:hypothetical protein n=1 Tax=Amycolatopsis solani TaxID=3028615 RepID=UPI0025B1C992|nr:hypothetical protein [Amycolatopsis sp. MEP2-6]
MTRPSSPAEVSRAILAARDFDTALIYIAAESQDHGHRVTRADWRRKWECPAPQRARCPLPVQRA